jgi:hypothetical protein
MSLVESQFAVLKKKYPYLYLFRDKRDFIIKGTIFIEGDNLKESYEIEIRLGTKYPSQIPYVKEIGSKIPTDFHHYQDGYLCLELPLRVWEIFRQDETLLNFVDSLLVPYLFSYTCFKNTGKLPFGERRHDTNGILDDYKDRLEISDDLIIVDILRILAEDIYRGHHLCPCGSKKKLRNCHGRILLDMKSVGYNFMKDYLMILCELKNNKRITDVSKYLSPKVKMTLDNIKSRPSEKWGY